MSNIINVHALKIGILLNFPKHCGVERTNEAEAILDELVAENEALSKEVSELKLTIQNDETKKRELIRNMESINEIFRRNQIKL